MSQNVYPPGHSQKDTYRYIEILAPQLENFIQDNFPEVSDEDIPGVSKALVEIVLTEHRALLLKEKQEAMKQQTSTDNEDFKKTYKELSKQFKHTYSPKSGWKDAHEWRTDRSSAIRAR